MGRGQLRSVCKGWAGPGPKPHRTGRRVREAVGMEEGNGVKQRRDEVGSDRNRAQTCRPASREEERRGLTSVSAGHDG